MIKDIKNILAKELKSYFVSPMLYVIFTVIFIVSGIFFYNILVSYQSTLPELVKTNWGKKIGFELLVMKSFFDQISVVFLFFLPLLSMRILSEENKSGTLELLLTSPISQISIIIGKFLAVIIIYSIILVINAGYFLLIIPYASDVIKISQIISAILGVFLLGASLLSFGIFASSLTKSQIIAALISFAFNLIFWIINSLSYYFAGKTGEFFTAISLFEHFQPFVRGIVDTRGIIYFISVISLGLYFTNLAIESRRWRN